MQTNKFYFKCCIGIKGLIKKKTEGDKKEETKKDAPAAEGKKPDQKADAKKEEPKKEQPKAEAKKEEPKKEDKKA